MIEFKCHRCQFDKNIIDLTFQFDLNVNVIVVKQNFSSAKTYYTALALNGFDDQERNLTFVKMDFRVLKLKLHACNFK